MISLKRLTAHGKFKLIALFWIALCIFSTWFNYSHNALNNYRIFIGVFKHLVAQTNLYNEYPLEHGDTNHYGPLFGLFIAPFTYLPVWLGNLLWVLLNGGLLFYAILLLPLSTRQRLLVLILSTLEFANTTHSSQSNCIVTAIIIFSFILIERGKDEWATCLIILGAFIKIYPVMALVFFLFSKRKHAFILSSIAWCVVFLIAPMFISSQHFVLQSYVDWYASLQAKNLTNRIIGDPGNYTILGVIDGITKTTTTPNALIIGLGLSVFTIPLLRVAQYASQTFRLFYLSSVLLFVVLFSTSSEHPTYIIAVIGAFIWMVQLPDLFSKKYTWLIIALLILTGLGPTDAFPAYIRANFIDVYAVKAWPCIIVWYILSYRLLLEQFYLATAASRSGDGVIERRSMRL